MRLRLTNVAVAASLICAYSAHTCSAAALQRRDTQFKPSADISSITEQTKAATDSPSIDQLTGVTTGVTTPPSKFLEIQFTLPQGNSQFPVALAQLIEKEGKGVDVGLAVSLDSKETWFRSGSQSVCADITGDECRALAETEKDFEYVGIDDMKVKGSFQKTHLRILRISGIKSLEIPDYEVGLAIEAPEVNQTERLLGGIFGSDGVLGLGPGSTFVEKLKLENKCAIYMGKSESSLIIGGYYLENRKKGEFQTFDGNGKDGEPLRLRLGDRGLWVAGQFAGSWIKGEEVTIDSTSPFISLPESVIVNIAQKIPYLERKDNWLHLKPGQVPQPFHITLEGGIDVVIRPEDYLQIRRVNGIAINETKFKVTSDQAPKIILGRPFLQSIYLLIEGNGRFRIALAETGPIESAPPVPFPPTTDSSNDDDNDDDNDDEEPTIADPKNIDLGSSGPPPDTETAEGKANSSGPNAGVIAGGVLGGLFLIIVILAVIFFLRRRKQRPAAPRPDVRGRGLPGDVPTRAISSMGLTSQPTASSGFSNHSPPPEGRHLMEGYAYNTFSPTPDHLPPQGMREINIGSATIAPLSSEVVISPPATGISHDHRTSDNDEDDDDDITVLSSPSNTDGRYRSMRTTTLDRSVSISTIADVSPSSSVYAAGSRAGAGGRRKKVGGSGVPRLPFYDRSDGEKDTAL